MGKTPSFRLQSEQLRTSAGILRAAAHPLRLRIIHLLHTQQGATVQTIYTQLNLEQSVVSQQLRILREADLVFAVRQGKHVQYLLNEPLLIRAALVAGALNSPGQAK